MPQGSLIDDLERSIIAAGDELALKVKQDAALVGDRGVFERKVPDRENVAFYERMREDPIQWANLIAQHGLRSATEFGVAMEKLRRKSNARSVS